MQYKSCRIIDGKPKWIIVDENGDIINKNPKKEGLNLQTTVKKIHKCKRCGINIIKFGRRFSGKWLCHSCYYKKQSQIRKGILNPNSNQAKGLKYEEITCESLKVKNLNIENDNFNTPIDHSNHPTLGVLQTKSANISYYKGRIYWSFSLPYIKEFDNMICYCIDENDHIERIYIIPIEEIIKRPTKITISKNNSITMISWYDKYRVDVEVFIKGEIRYIHNNFRRIPIDHTNHSILGVLQTRSAGISYQGILPLWHFSNLAKEKEHEFDNMVYYCISKNHDIERIYIIPREEIIRRTDLTIIKNPSRGKPWYDKYRVDVEAFMKDEIKYINR